MRHTGAILLDGGERRRAMTEPQAEEREATAPRFGLAAGGTRRAPYRDSLGRMPSAMASRLRPPPWGESDRRRSLRRAASGGNGRSPSHGGER